MLGSFQINKKSFPLSFPTDSVLYSPSCASVSVGGFTVTALRVHAKRKLRRSQFIIAPGLQVIKSHEVKFSDSLFR